MPAVEAVLLGNAQDAGVPQAGCRCQRCDLARRDSAQRRFPTSLAIIDHDMQCFWLIDATPSVGEQLDLLPLEKLAMYGENMITPISQKDGKADGTLRGRHLD